jgi:predicted acyltransferase
VALLVLLAYWPLTLFPIPGQATDLLIPGANFISHVDHIVLGPHVFLVGPHAYDPEGILSTLPAIAQCLLGALAGEWLLNNRHANSAALKLSACGAATLALGLVWSPFFPIVKNIWTSSYVLVSTGLVMLLLALCYWALDRRRIRFGGMTVLQAFGMNALLAYVLQGAAQLLPAGNDMHAIGAASLTMYAPAMMASAPILVFLVMLWIPLEFLRRRRWIVKI